MEGTKTHLNDLPPTSKLISQLFLHPCDGREVRALLDFVIRSHYDLARLCVSEQKDLLRVELNDKNWDVVLKDFTSRYLDVWQYMR